MIFCFFFIQICARALFIELLLKFWDASEMVTPARRRIVWKCWMRYTLCMWMMDGMVASVITWMEYILPNYRTNGPRFWWNSWRISPTDHSWQLFKMLTATDEDFPLNFAQNFRWFFKRSKKFLGKAEYMLATVAFSISFFLFFFLNFLSIQ